MAKDQKYFPTIPKKHWWNLRNQFKRNIPGVVSASYLANVLNMAEKSAQGNVLPSLKMVGLVDETGSTVKENVVMFRDDDQYSEFCNRAIESCYPQELRDIHFAPDSDLTGIKKWFMSKNAIGESAAYKMATFYQLLLQANSLESSEKKKESESKIRTSKKTEPAGSKAEKKEEQLIQDDRSQLSPVKQKNVPSQPSLNINIEIHISSDATPDQIETVFENMAKYIYKY